jgi:Cu+-exporting ATPase
LVFDKTGTITHNKEANIVYEGNALSEFDKINLKSLLKNSNHPLSKTLYQHLEVGEEYLPVENFQEIAGKGYSGTVRGNKYKIGSASFNSQQSKNLETAVYISHDETYLGKYIFTNEYRGNMAEMFGKFQEYPIHILSGDNASEEIPLKSLVPHIAGMKFNQSPENKLNYIKELQDENRKVAMLGDGLNDAGALKQSNVGIAVADDTHSFTPSSDVIMAGEKMPFLKDYFDLSKDAITIVKITFGISFFYNIIGLSFAVTGHLSPLVAAILMPISSITVVIFTSVATWARSTKYFKTNKEVVKAELI